MQKAPEFASTMSKVLRNVLDEPGEPKFRRIKAILDSPRPTSADTPSRPHPRCRTLAAAPLLQRHLPRYHPDRQASNGAFKRAILDVAGGVEFLLALGWRVKVSCRPQPNVMPML